MDSIRNIPEVSDVQPTEARAVSRGQAEHFLTQFMISEQRRPFIDIDERGDLLVKLKEELDFDLEATTATFLVSSRSVALGSVVLKKMLFGPFKEGKRGGHEGLRMVSLYGDSPVNMLLLFSFLHGNRITHEVIMEPEGFLNRMYTFIVIVDKYDCLAALAEYVPRWINALVEHIPTSEAEQLYELAYIFYQLGSLVNYERVVSQLIHDCAFDHSLPPDVPVLPYTLHETISARRHEVIEKIVEPVREVIADLSNPDDREAHEKYCIAGAYRAICTATLKERLTTGLTQMGLWPIPDSNHHITILTPRQLYCDITELKRTTRTGPDVSHKHHRCGAFRPSTRDEAESQAASSWFSVLWTPERGLHDGAVFTGRPPALAARSPYQPSPPPPLHMAPGSGLTAALPDEDSGAWELYTGCETWGEWYRSTPGEKRVMGIQQDKL